jgi:hypothetical protein
MQFSHSSDELPLGRKATRWFRFRIAAWLEQYATQGGAGVVTKPDVLAALVEWYAEMPRRYLKWVAAERYFGSRYSSGGWELIPRVILQDLGDGIVEATRVASAAANAKFASLDEWLRADMNGSLAYSPEGGSSDLTKECRESLAFRALLRRSKVKVRTPKVCPSCGASWVARHGDNFPRDIRAKRCPDCREASSHKRTAPAQAAQ